MPPDAFVPFDPPRGAGPDPQGAAALSLIESLIHHLVERGSMTVADALAVVQTASDAQGEISHDRGDDPGIEPEAVRWLSAIAASLAIDAG